MDLIHAIRGMNDLLPAEAARWQLVEETARSVLERYGYKEIRTPVVEETRLFQRSIGETTDIVEKEMYTFEDRKGKKLTLRPEGTAGVVRAVLEHNLFADDRAPKVYYLGSMFRYERPQKGRQRQFHQVNFEWLGDDLPEVDVEIIMFAGHLLYLLSGKKGCTLLINTLGDKESRVKYRDALVDYLSPQAANLSEDSKRRLVLNPLRILDSKDPRDQAITANAPKITEYLSDASRQRFGALCAILETMPFLQNWRIEPSLVRGLDYYTDIVFEFVGEGGELGAQNTVLAGGRYDGLIGYSIDAYGVYSNHDNDYDEFIRLIKVTERDEQLIFSMESQKNSQ